MSDSLAGIDLFQWWAATITAGTTFLMFVGVYLYVDSREKRHGNRLETKKPFLRLLQDFTFVWVLLGLLVFYIATIAIGSDMIFVAGNIVVEIMLLVYLLRNRTKE